MPNHRPVPMSSSSSQADSRLAFKRWGRGGQRGHVSYGPQALDSHEAQAQNPHGLDGEAGSGATGHLERCRATSSPETPPSRVGHVGANDLANRGTGHSMTTSDSRARPACRSRGALTRADLARHVEGYYDSNVRPCLGVVSRDHCRASAVGGHGPAARVVRCICTALRPPGFAVGPPILQRACATRVRPSTIRGPRDSRLGCSHAFWPKHDLGRNITRRCLARNEEKYRHEPHEHRLVASLDNRRLKLCQECHSDQPPPQGLTCWIPVRTMSLSLGSAISMSGITSTPIGGAPTPRFHLLPFGSVNRTKRSILDT